MKIIPHNKELLLKHWLFKKGNIVFIHGFSSTYYKSIEFLFSLFKKGYNVYAFDLPNHGMNNDYDKQMSVEEYVNWIKEKIKKIGLKRFVLIGHSMGGGIASFIANEFDKISKLVLLDPFNFGYASSHRKLFVLALSVAKPFPAAVSPLLVKNPEVPSFDPRVLLLSMYKESFLDEMNQNVKKNNKPTLIIFGEKDDVINPVLSTNYFNEVCYDKKCVIKIMKNQKHSPHVYAVNETLNIVLSFIKHGK